MPNNGPLRIMHIAAPGRAGGLESVVLDLTSGFRKDGHEVLLAAVLDEGETDHPVPRRAQEAGVEVAQLRVPPRHYLEEYRALRRLVGEWRPDVVHTHGYRADLLGGSAARHERRPWISTVHGFVGGGRKNQFYEWLQVRSYRKAQAVVAVSRSVRDRLEREGVHPSRLHLIPNGWGEKPGLPREEARERLGVVGRTPLLGWVGRLSREKGADLFLEALARLTDVPWHAAILGDGRELVDLQARAARLGLANRVTWHGLVPEAAQYFRAFDLFVLSSRTEGTPIALLEAMGAGVPIVATSVGGVPDVISETEAVLVPAEDAPALAAAIRANLTNPDAARARAATARDRLQSRFSLQPWLASHERLYRRLATPTSAPSEA